MKLLSTLALLAVMTLSMHAQSSPKNALDFKMTDINGKEVDLSKFSGDVVLMVNVASKCGYTPQYEGLQKLHEKYAAQGLKIVAFPCNNFGSQEPGSHEEIAEFCKKNYGVTFPVMGKIDVKGPSQAPLYKYLTSDKQHGGDIRWNFEKFLIGRNGQIVGHYKSGVAPDSSELIGAIEAELKKAAKKS